MTTTSNIFELAVRRKIRFDSTKGQISTEQLFDLPLTSRDGLDLNSVAVLTSRNLKEIGEESFVNVTPNPARATLELKLEIVKSVIATKQAEFAAAQDAVARRAEKDKLLGILSKKQDAALEELTPEQIAKRLADLG